MIAAHQPTIFGDTIIAGVSSVSDGTMKLSGSEHARQYITDFTGALGITPDAINYQVVTYDRKEYTDYRQLGRPAHPFQVVVADGIATTTPGAALFLNIADCTGAILYDPIHQALMVSHLGRHSTEQQGALHSVRFLHDEFGSEPEDLLVWLGPSPNGEIYPLWLRDNKSFIETNVRDLAEAGVPSKNIEVSAVDTATDRDYFSHSEFLKGHRDADGRFAIVAMLRG